MKKEQVLEFTRRISSSNRSGLTLVTYDILFAYLEDAKNAYENKEWESFKQSIRYAEKSIQELMNVLDFSYELAKNLYQIYAFCRDSLAVAMYKRSIQEIEEAGALLQKLYQSFAKAAESDDSEVLMRNAQKVYAGYTYGREDVVENLTELNKSRGFLV